MKIAIIGAGLAGLACAHEFERNGVAPDIYERNGYIGEQITHTGALLQIMYRPVKDILDFMNEKLDISIKPLNYIKTLYHKSQFSTATITGNLGYFTYRGQIYPDLKLQLCSKLKKSNILLNTIAECSGLSQKYDIVVDASGQVAFSNEYGCFNQYFSGYIHGAVMHGDFNPNTLIMYVNKIYCKNGYAYLTPISKNKASVAVVVPYIDDKEIDHFWESFIYAENLNYEIEEEFKQLHVAGLTYPLQTGNIYFVGNAGGSIDTLLGFGQFSSIFMGVMAARSILTGVDYYSLVQRIITRNLEMYKIRKAFDSVTNKGVDNFFAMMHLPGVNSVIYNTNLNILKYIAKLLKD